MSLTVPLAPFLGVSVSVSWGAHLQVSTVQRSCHRGYRARHCVFGSVGHFFAWPGWAGAGVGHVTCVGV